MAVADCDAALAPARPVDRCPRGSRVCMASAQSRRALLVSDVRSASRDWLRCLVAHVLVGGRSSTDAANVVLSRALRLQRATAVQHREVPCV